MVYQSSAGVTSIEKEFKVAVNGLITTSVGIIGTATKGPFELTKLTSVAQLRSIFGENVEGDFGLESAEVVLRHSKEVYFQRIANKGVRATAEDGGLIIFTAKKGGTTLNGSTIKISVSEETKEVSISVIDKEENTLETVICSTNPLEESYVYNKYNKDSEFFNIKFDTGLSFTDKELTVSKGTDGIQYATAGVSGDCLQFESKEYDSTLNKSTIVLLGNKDNVTIRLVKGFTVLEEIKNMNLNPESTNYVVKKYNKESQYFNIIKHNTGVDYVSKSIQVSGANSGLEGVTDSDVLEGLQIFKNSDAVDIFTLITPGWSSPEILRECELIAEERRDIIYIPDAPLGLTPKTVNQWANAEGMFTDNYKLRSSFTFLAWPWGYKNKANGRKYVPISAYIAAQFCYSDSKGKFWDAPAGLKRGMIEGLDGLEYVTNKDERDLGYSGTNIINPVMNYKNRGIVLWGNKTALRDSESPKGSTLTSLNVRRLMNYIRKVVSTSTDYVVFDTNDSYTWNEWKLMIDPILKKIKDNRGLYDYKIVMDETTVTEDDINNLRMPGSIWLKPTRVAEFIPLTFVLTPYGIDFEEIEDLEANK